MSRVDWMVWLQKARPLRAPMLVVALSALLALLFTIVTRPADDGAPRAAGEAKVQLVKDEHALVADLVRDIRAKDEAERLAAEQSRAAMRERALSENLKQDSPGRPERAAKVAARITLPLPKPEAAVEPPLQVAAVPPPQKPEVSRARAALAAVGEIPRWLRTGAENVADWAMSAPAKAISQLPERRFL